MRLRSQERGKGVIFEGGKPGPGQWANWAQWGPILEGPNLPKFGCHVGPGSLDISNHTCRIFGDYS